MNIKQEIEFWKELCEDLRGDELYVVMLEIYNLEKKLK